MKTGFMKIAILFFFLLLVSGTVTAQLITITELDESGNSRLLGERRQAIDINSKLNIVINKDAITSHIDSQLISGGSTQVDSLIAQLRVYKSFIQRLDAAIQQYALLFDAPGDTISTAMLAPILRERAQAGQSIVKLFPDGSRFHRRREEELPFVAGKGSNENFRIILRLLAEEIEFVENDLADLRKEAGFYFQLAAWFVSSRGTEPLHIDGFDELAPGEFFHFERNQLYLTPEQLTELQDLNSFFEDMDRSDVFEKFADLLPGILEKAVDEELIHAQIAQLKTSISGIVTQARAEKENVLARTNEIEIKFNVLKQDLHNLIEKYTRNELTAEALTKGELLRFFMDDISNVNRQISVIVEDIKGLITSVDFQALGAGVNSIKTDFTSLHTTLGKQAQDLLGHAREGYQFAVYGRQINAAALELSEEILKLSIDNIPSSTVLDLHYAGKRDPGDLLLLKALIWKGEETSPVITEVQDYPVMNALPHIQMNVAYSFAKPTSTESNWKGGPLVSILYKFKSHSLAYRNFMDVGIGLHAASYDFNNDDTPEFAGGAVLSLFKDYLQAGWGFNFNANRGYWFAGLRIPIPTAPVSLAGS